MISAPWRATNNIASVCAGIVSLRATRHRSFSSLEASSCELVFTVSNVLSAFIKLIAVFVRQWDSSDPSSLRERKTENYFEGKLIDGRHPLTHGLVVSVFFL